MAVWGTRTCCVGSSFQSRFFYFKFCYNTELMVQIIDYYLLICKKSILAKSLLEN